MAYYVYLQADTAQHFVLTLAQTCFQILHSVLTVLVVTLFWSQNVLGDQNLTIESTTKNLRGNCH